ncbi:hypothetical protein KAW43_02510 [Candidatus Parcubacteria bacterium]|nr:hypothetical protein [Candidatus Parcubacteria bacterium]
MKKISKILIGLLVALVVGIGWFFVGNAAQSENIVWGVNFSQTYAQDLGMDWKETYLALLDDLDVKNLKIITHWDLLEPAKDEFYFDDLNWQINEAEKRDVKILLVTGMKTGRWPECHIPEWAENLNKQDREQEILELLEQIVSNYGGSTSINAWQIENEPFFPFGKCPKIDKKFLKEEIDLVKSLDSENRPIIISESGEFSFFTKSARMGDIVGITMYKTVWFEELETYIKYPFPPIFYARKARIIEKIFDKKVICIELQAEPWGPVLLYDLPIEEQKKTMNLELFKNNVEFAKNSGLDEFYLWGGEWWYWLKTTQDSSEIWDFAGTIINE